jgi:hypothetical protein
MATTRNILANCEVVTTTTNSNTYALVHRVHYYTITLRTCYHMTRHASTINTHNAHLETCALHFHCAPPYVFSWYCTLRCAPGIPRSGTSRTPARSSSLAGNGNSTQRNECRLLAITKKCRSLTIATSIFYWAEPQQ